MHSSSMQAIRCHIRPQVSLPARHVGMCRAAAGREPAKRKAAAKPSAKDASASSPKDTAAAKDNRNPRSREQGLSRSAAGTPDPVELASAPPAPTPVAGPAPGAEAVEQPSEEAVIVGEAAQDLVSGAEAAGEELKEAVEEGEKLVEQVVSEAEAVGTEMQDAVADSGEAITEALVETGESVIAVVEETGESVKGALKGAFEGLKRRGQNYDATQRAALEQSVSLTSLSSAPPVGASHDSAREHLRLRLLACVAGTDRGFAVSKSQGAQVLAAAEALAHAGGTVDLSSGSDSGEAAGGLAGLWRLVYSSGFASGSTGGMRPGLPLKLLPAQLGQIYQGISDDSGRLDNIVVLRRAALPSLPFLPPNEPAVATLTLKHTFTITAPDTVEITFIGTDANLEGGVAGILSLVPEIRFPELPESLRPEKASSRAMSKYRVTYLDDDLRITKGDRGELRVFLRT